MGSSSGGFCCCVFGLFLGAVLGLIGAVGIIFAADAGHIVLARADVEGVLGAAGVPPGHRIVSLLAGSSGSEQLPATSTEDCQAGDSEKAQALEAELKQLQMQLASSSAAKDAGTEKIKLLEAELGQAYASAKRAKELEATLEPLQAQLQEVRTNLNQERSAWASEREELRAQVQQASAATASEMAKAAPVEPWKTAAEAAWPTCVMEGTGLRDTSTHAFTVDVGAVLGDSPRGCSDGNCAATSTFDVESIDDCARVCAAIEGCAFWSSSTSGSGRRCQLWAGDAGGREAVEDSAAAMKGCVPPATQISPAQMALAVLDSPAVLACDGGVVGAQCTDLHDAMRTWTYGIRRLKTAMAGTSNDINTFLHQTTDKSSKQSDTSLPTRVQ